ncbi:class I adenylate-forming enzyme family protein, partial [Catenulispora rubra]|uniref:class I adenylate-forming enzyme family protein n=1 Tax=Catenulispora rubra TaxID=280293 RepID=UPI00189268BD
VGWGPGDIVHTDQLMLGLPALAAGATWSLSGLPGKASRTLEHLRTRRATHLFGTPAEIARLLDAGPVPPTLRTVLLGAAPVPPPILRRLRQAAPDAQILAVYGTTEALPIAVATAEEKLDALGLGDLLGTPLPGVRASVAGAGSGETPGTAPGEIRIRSPHLAVGYLGDPEPLAELATGDLGRLDPDGRLILLGRAKDMIITGSFNLYPGLYEPAIAALPGVADAAYVGIPDPATGDEHVVLAVVPEPGTDPDALTRRLHAELPRVIDTAARPARIAVVDTIPRRGRTEKPDRDALRTLLARSVGTETPANAR